MVQINIYGTGGHALVIADIVRALGCEIGCFYDDAPRYSDLDSVKILKPSDCEVTGPVIIAIGDNNTRRRIAQSLQTEFATAVHPTAIVSPSAKVGEGTVVMHGAIIQARATVGCHSIINTGASVDHECRIGDYVHISPHATLCGNVQVGDNSWIGAASVLIPGIKVGRNSIVGAGSVVNHNVPDNVVVCGNPARIIKKLNNNA